MWNVTLRVCLNSGSLAFFSRAKVTSTIQCKRCSILNFDWVNLVFAALNLIFRGHEAGLLRAYWVIISCGLCFRTRCPWQDLISDAVVKCFISFDLCLLRLNKDFSFFWFSPKWLHLNKYMHACKFLCPWMWLFPAMSVWLWAQLYSIVWFAGFWISTDSAIFRFELYTVA